MHVDYLVKYTSSEEYIRLRNWLADHHFKNDDPNRVTEYEWHDAGSHAFLIEDSNGHICYEYAEVFVAAAYMSGRDPVTKQKHRYWLVDEFISMMEEKEKLTASE